MKRTIKLLSALTAILLVLLTALPAMAGTLTVHYKQDDSIKNEKRFDFKQESIYLAAYQIGEGNDWNILNVYDDIQVFDENKAFQKGSITEIRKRIQEKGIAPVAYAWTQATGDNEGTATLQVVQDGMYLVVQIDARTKGTVKSNDMVLATNNGKNTTEAKWEYTPPDKEDDEVPPEEKRYTLTIYYLYWDPDEKVYKTAFKTYQEKELWEGYYYQVPSGVLPDYVCTLELVEGKMPAKDMVYWVYYYPKREGKRKIPLEDYETPLGLGDIQMHVGVCFE